MSTRYIAKLEYGKPRLVQVEIEKETPKTLTLKGKWLNLIGEIFYLPERLSKKNYNIFETEQQAIRYLLIQAEARLTDIEKMLSGARAQVEELREMIIEEEQGNDPSA
jgi:hypothetical protein